MFYNPEKESLKFFNQVVEILKKRNVRILSESVNKFSFQSKNYKAYGEIEISNLNKWFLCHAIRSTNRFDIVDKQVHSHIYAKYPHTNPNQWMDFREKKLTTKPLEVAKQIISALKEMDFIFSKISHDVYRKIEQLDKQKINLIEEFIKKIQKIKSI